MGDLYETDVLEWSEHQARVLRQQVAGKPGNEVPDWANIIEEIESVGRSELNSVESLLIHDLKCEAWPFASYVPHWRAEARVFRGGAARRFTSSMRQRIDVAYIYQQALGGLPDTMDGRAPLPVPNACTVSLDELLSET